MVEILNKFPDFIVPSPGIFMPFPGTEACQKALSAGWQPPHSLAEWGNIVSKADCREWLGSKIGSIAKQTAFFASALDIKINPRANPILEFMRQFYSQLAKIRGKYGFVRFVPEYLIFQSFLKKFFQKKKSVK